MGDITGKTPSSAYGNEVLEHDLTCDNATMSAHDEDAKVKASGADSGKGYLEDEIVAGAGVSLAVLGADGENKKLEISSSGGGGGAIAPPVQDITALKAIDTTSAGAWPDKIEILVEDTGLYRLDRDSSDSESLPSIVAPTTGVGRWFRISAHIDDHNQLANIQGGTTGERNHLTNAELAALHTHANQAQLDLVTDGDHDVRTDNPHATDVGNLGSGTLAELNAAITDATLDDSGDSRPPTSHASSHQNGGGDEINVAGLSGVLADPQTPASHTHDSGDITDLGSWPATEIPWDLLTVLSTTALGDAPRGLAIQGKYLYAMEATNSEMHIYDISDPNAPRLISSTSMGTQAHKILVMGSYAYIIDLDDDLYVVDIRNPASPSIKSTTALSGGNAEPWNIAGAGNFIYIAGLFSDSVHVYDISDPANPVNTDTFNLNTITVGSAGLDIQVQGKYVYTTSIDNNKLFILDVSDPYNVTHVGNVTTATGRPGCLSVSGAYVYLVTQTGLVLEIYDVSDPSTPVKVTTTPTSLPIDTQPMCVDSVGKYVIATGTNHIHIFDVEDPTTPVEVYQLTDLSQRDLFVWGDILAVTRDGGNNDIRLFQIPSIKAGGAELASARIGQLEVTKRMIATRLDIHGGVNVGVGGLNSDGPISNCGRRLDDILTVSAARNNPVVTDVYLRGSDGTPMNLAGYTLPWDARLIAISLAASASGNWTAEVRKNDSATVEDSLAVTGEKAYKSINQDDQILFDAGDEIQLYLNGTGISNPRVDVMFKRL